MFSDTDSDTSSLCFTSDEDTYDLNTIDVYGVLDLLLHNNDEQLIKNIMDFVGYECNTCDKKEVLNRDEENCKECKVKYTCDVCKEFCGDCIYECEDCDAKCCQDTDCTYGFMNVYVNGSFEMCYVCMEARLY